MSKTNKKRSSNSPADNAPPTLAEVLKALESVTGLPATRARDLRSAVKRVAALLGETPHQIILNLPQISARLAAVDPVTAQVTTKRLGNVRSDFLAAVKVSGLAGITGATTPALTRAWADLIDAAALRRIKIGISRFARFASAHGVAPDEVDNATVDRFIGFVTEQSLHRNPEKLRRTVVAIWNELSSSSAVHALIVPASRNMTKRIDWQVLPASFRTDVDDHLRWCAVSDVFDPRSRARELAPQSIHLRRNQIHSAVSALVDSGVDPATITSLRDLVSPEAVRRVLRQRLQTHTSRDSAFNRGMAKALLQIAKEWAGDDPAAIAVLKRVVAKRGSAFGLTAKNKRFLRQFDDPLARMRLFELPARLWAEVKRDKAANFRTLAKAQVALAVGILTYMPIRIQNLAALEFDRHLFLREGRGAISTLELESHEVKNRKEVAFDIPEPLVRMLIEYRDRIAAKIIDRRPRGVFINPDGTFKTATALSDLISRTVKRWTGIVLTPHQFRHLSAKLLLDHSPGNFETVRQLLGHANLKTTVGFYTGIDSRRAALHHQRLIQAEILAQQDRGGRKRRKTDRTSQPKKKSRDREGQS